MTVSPTAQPCQVCSIPHSEFCKASTDQFPLYIAIYHPLEYPITKNFRGTTCRAAFRKRRASNKLGMTWVAIICQQAPRSLLARGSRIYIREHAHWHTCIITLPLEREHGCYVRKGSMLRRFLVIVHTRSRRNTKGQSDILIETR